jgi:hypothetical protein
MEPGVLVHKTTMDYISRGSEVEFDRLCLWDFVASVDKEVFKRNVISHVLSVRQLEVDPEMLEAHSLTVIHNLPPIDFGYAMLLIPWLQLL